MNDKITFNEFKKEIDKFRDEYILKKNLTKEQIEFVKLCRDNERKIPYTKMIRLWEKFGWGKIAKSTLQDKANEILGKHSEPI